MPKCPLCGVADEPEIAEDFGPTGDTIFGCGECGTTWALEEETGEAFLIGE